MCIYTLWPLFPDNRSGSGDLRSPAIVLRIVFRTGRARAPLAGQAAWPASPADPDASRGLRGLRSEQQSCILHTHTYL